MKKKNVVYVAKIGVLSAIAAVIMLLEFPLPFAPSFYKLDLSEIAVLIAGFGLGPVAGILTELVKILLNLCINGTDTAMVGEFANFCIGISFVLPASLLYKKVKSLKGALIGLVIGTFSLALAGALLNYYVMLPFYGKVMGMEAIINAGNAINPNINSLWTFILFATVPFNLVKGVACSVITTLVYKRVSPILHKEF